MIIFRITSTTSSSKTNSFCSLEFRQVNLEICWSFRIWQNKQTYTHTQQSYVYVHASYTYTYVCDVIASTELLRKWYCCCLCVLKRFRAHNNNIESPNSSLRLNWTSARSVRLLLFRDSGKFISDSLASPSEKNLNVKFIVRILFWIV